MTFSLESLFANQSLVKPETGDYGKPQIILKEVERPDNPSYQIAIKQVPEHTFAIKTDKFPLSNFLNCTSKIGQCKQADFVIIATTERKIIFIELAARKKQENKIIQQFKGAQCVMYYCSSIADKFYNDNFLENYQSHFVSIYNIITTKRPLKTHNNKANTTPKQMLKISSPHNLQFRKLLQK